MPLRSMIPLTLAALLLAAPAPAQQTAPNDTTRDVEELARDAIDKLMRAMGLLLQSIPQYEMPELQPNGDIIIRRKPPVRDPPAKPAPREDRT